METDHTTLRPPFRYSAIALGIVLLGTSVTASAVVFDIPGPTQASHVTDTVTAQGTAPQTWLYEYTVYNDGRPGFDMYEETIVDPQIRDWELPWFGDEGIASIQSPTGWNWAIETENNPNSATGWDGVIQWKVPGDPWHSIFQGTPFANVTQVLHWYTNDPQYYIPTDSFEGQNSLSGFSFIAEFDKTAAPYQASWAFLQTQTGDPALPLGGTPNSPLARGSVVPEPASLLLMGAGLLGLGFSRRGRRGTKTG